MDEVTESVALSLVRKAARLRVMLQDERRMLRRAGDELADEIVALSERLSTEMRERELTYPVEDDLVRMALGALAGGCGFPMGVRDEGLPVGHVLTIDLPVGQVAWPVPYWVEEVGAWPTYRGLCDGHNREEQEQRLRAFVAQGLRVAAATATGDGMGR